MNAWKWKKPVQAAGMLAAAATIAFVSFLPRIAKWNEEGYQKAEEASSRWVRTQIEFVESKQALAEKLMVGSEEREQINSTASQEFERAEGCKKFERPEIQKEPIKDDKIAAKK